MDRPVLERFAHDLLDWFTKHSHVSGPGPTKPPETGLLREPGRLEGDSDGLAREVPEGQESGFCRDGTIGERGEKDADFDEDGTKLMPYLRQIHKFGHLKPAKLAGEYSNQDIEDLDAGYQSFFNQPLTQRKTESDIASRGNAEGSGAPADLPITDDEGEQDKPAPTKFNKVGHLKTAYELHGHTEFQGLPIAIENRAGSVRKGVDKDGHKWRTKMIYPYGYIESTEGADGEGVDCYVGPKKDTDKAFVVHQKDPETGKHDEDKVMLGFSSKKEAKEAFMAHYDDPEKFLGPIDVVSMDRLTELVADKERLVKISAMLQEVTKLAFDQVLGMGPEPRGPLAGAPMPWQPSQAPVQQPTPSPFAEARQDIRSIRNTANLARKLWEARSLPLLV